MLIAYDGKRGLGKDHSTEIYKQGELVFILDTSFNQQRNKDSFHLRQAESRADKQQSRSPCQEDLGCKHTIADDLNITFSIPFMYIAFNKMARKWYSRAGKCQNTHNYLSSPSGFFFIWSRILILCCKVIITCDMLK